jgi:hypothetical protein
VQQHTGSACLPHEHACVASSDACSSSTCGFKNPERCSTAQVARLERELGDVHSADYNTLRRAYVSLVQHFRALQVEAQVKQCNAS